MNKINQNLNFSNSGSSNQQSPRLVHCGEAYGACPGFFRASQQHHFLIKLRTEKQMIPFAANKGGHGNTSDPSELKHRDKSKWWSPCFLLKTYKIWAAARTPQLQTKGSKVCRQFTSRQKNIFLKRNNLFRIKQKQLNCERTFEWQLLLSCVSHKKGFSLLFQKSCVHSTKQEVIFFHLKHRHWHHNSRYTTLSCHFSKMHKY